MRRKYPSAAAGRSALLEKRLSRGVPKFFDSGDYNLAKAAKDPKHKNKLNLGYPLAVHTSSPSPGDKPVSPLSPMYNPVNPLTPPSTPVDNSMNGSAAGVVVAAAATAAAAGLTEDEAPALRKARPPSAIDLHRRRISRQPSRLADEADDDLEAALRQQQQQSPDRQQD